MRIYKKILGVISTLFEIIAAVFLCAMVLVIFYHVIMRYFFSLAPRWSEEVALQLMIWFCFIAMFLGVKNQAHIAIEVLVSRLPKKVIYVVELLDKILIGVFGCVIFWSIIPYITRLSRNRLAATGWPVWIQFAAPCAIGVLIVLAIAEQVIIQLKEGPKAPETEKKREVVNL
ncbi:TRAP transporter permease [Synergistales bacterium]|nr:TRAP transporter permease [Synergistales bacterium]